MTGNTKRKALLWLGLIILAVMIIAADLPHLELQPGMPLPSLQPGKVVVAQVEEARFVSISINQFFLVLVALILSGIALYVTVQLIRGLDRKLILESLRYLGIISLGVIFLVFLIMLLPKSSDFPSAAIPVQTPEPVVTSPLGAAPPFLLWLVGLSLLAISVFVILWVFTPARQSSPIELLGLEAEKARQALRSGMDLKDVILHCYRQMSQALKQDQGLERKAFMTTGEFEHLVEAAGFPHEPIHRLTQLFEAVRYGNWQPNAGDEQLASRCLEDIIAYSRNTRSAS